MLWVLVRHLFVTENLDFFQFTEHINIYPYQFSEDVYRSWFTVGFPFENFKIVTVAAVRIMSFVLPYPYCTCQS